MGICRLMRLSLEQLPQCEPACAASAGRQQRPMAPVPLSDFSRARAFHPPAPAAASQAFPPPAPGMKSARGFSPNPPLACKIPGAAASVPVPAGSCPQPCIKPLASEEARGESIANATSPGCTPCSPSCRVLGEHQAPPCPNPATCRGSQPLAGCPGSSFWQQLGSHRCRRHRGARGHPAPPRRLQHTPQKALSGGFSAKQREILQRGRMEEAKQRQRVLL